MKYKVGDKVILKDNIDNNYWSRDIKIWFNNLKPKIVTISEVDDYYNTYKLEEVDHYTWPEYLIKEKYEETQNPINSRFDILDL
jgi:hypothetical protein